MTQEELFDDVLSIQCTAATLAAKWAHKVKLGKWCPEQECALMLADWALDILCNHEVCGEVPVSKDNQINGILQVPTSPDDYTLLLPLEEDTNIELTVNGEEVLVLQTVSPFLGFNYNMALILTTYFDNVVIYNDNGTYETPEDVPVGEVVYYNITTPCNEPIETIDIRFVIVIGPKISIQLTASLTQPTPEGELLLGPIITPGECVDPNGPCFTNCFTDEQICTLIKKINKVLTYNCNCC
jgi:hypothetical protein